MGLHILQLPSSVRPIIVGFCLRFFPIFKVLISSVCCVFYYFQPRGNFNDVKRMLINTVLRPKAHLPHKRGRGARPEAETRSHLILTLGTLYCKHKKLWLVMTNIIWSLKGINRHSRLLGYCLIQLGNLIISMYHL